MEMILKKRQIYYSEKEKDYKSMKTYNAAEMIQEQGFKPYLKLIKTLQKKRKILNIDNWWRKF